MSNTALGQQAYPKKIVIAFFASSSYGTEYRSGWELLSYAKKIGFDIAIISDIEKNETKQSLESLLPGIQSYIVPSFIKRKRLLHIFSDFLPQLVWHYRVADFINSEFPTPLLIWIANGAQPWLPLSPYLKNSNAKIIWGPVGGGEECPETFRQHLGFLSYIRELIRNRLQAFFTQKKAKLIKSVVRTAITPLARTRAAKANLEKYIQLPCEMPIVPEILYPTKLRTFKYDRPRHAQFIWVGQHISRKNLTLALSLFKSLRSNYFPLATLNIYGASANNSSVADGVLYHGWVSSINWESYSGSGILLLTSFREGLPSVLLEALQNGLLCVSTAVGSIPEINCEQLITIPMENYPEISDSTMHEIVLKIHNYLCADSVTVPTISFENRLNEALCRTATPPKKVLHN